MLINYSTKIDENNVGVLSDLKADAIKLNLGERKEYEPILWRSICSEYDSINFYKKLDTLGLKHTPGFNRFLIGWLQDEAMHTAGFKKIYSFIYGVSETEIDRKLESRVSDFSKIEEFFENEFMISLLLAFDEIVTTHVYDRSIPFYRSVESEILPVWIRSVKTDEARHFVGITKVIKKEHQYNYKNASKILKRIVDVDAGLSEYEGTFVLDHACPEFPLSKDELINICVDMVLKKIL